MAGIKIKIAFMNDSSFEQKVKDKADEMFKNNWPIGGNAVGGYGPGALAAFAACDQCAAIIKELKEIPEAKEGVTFYQEVLKHLIGPFSSRYKDALS